MDVDSTLVPTLRPLSVLGITVFKTGMITSSMLVALILVALVISVTSGTLIEYFLRRPNATVAPANG